MEKRTMGALMSALRKSKGMTQQDVADKLGISNKTVSKWECDDGYPDISMLPAIAEIYGVSVDELLKGEIINEEKQEKAISTDKSKKQIDLLLSTAFEKFKHTSVIALALALLSVVLGFLFKNILDDFMFENTASLIAFCVSLIMSVIAIVLEWFAGNRLSFSFSGEEVINCTDKTAAYLKNARNFISVVIGISLVGIFGNGAEWYAVYYDLVETVNVVIGILIALIISSILFFLVGGKLITCVDNENARKESSHSRKTALGLIIVTVCVALVASGLVGAVYKITNNHTVKFDNEAEYNDCIAYVFEGRYPLIEKDEKSLQITVTDEFSNSLPGHFDVELFNMDSVINHDCGQAQIVLSYGEQYLFDTDIYTFDNKENMEKIIDEYCVDSGFLSDCPFEMIFCAVRFYEHNDDKLTIKYSTGNFNDIAGICALTVIGSCIVFDVIYVIVRSKRKRAD